MEDQTDARICDGEWRARSPPYHSYDSTFCNGKDGSILFGGLASIIMAMRNRADQPKIDEDGEELLRLEFENEERFPVGNMIPPSFSTIQS